MSASRSSGIPTESSTEWWQPYVSDYGSEKPSKFARALAETIALEPNTKRLLDLGCGCGIIGLYCLIEKKTQSVTFSDLMPVWIDKTRVNVALKIEEGKIIPSQAAVTDDMHFRQIPLELLKQHDMLAFNPPQYPEGYATTSELDKLGNDPTKATFRLAGPEGLEIAQDFFEWYSSLEQPKPDVVIVLSSFLGKRNIVDAIESCHLQWAIIAETRVFLRDEFSRKAEQFFENTEEKQDRMLQRDGVGWTKKLLTIKITDHRE